MSTAARPRPPRTRLAAARPDGPLSITERLAAFPRLITVEELAGILNVHRSGIYRMIEAGKLPRCIVPGTRAVRFDPATVIRALRHCNPALDLG